MSLGFASECRCENLAQAQAAAATAQVVDQRIDDRYMRSGGNLAKPMENIAELCGIIWQSPQRSLRKA